MLMRYYPLRLLTASAFSLLATSLSGQVPDTLDRQSLSDDLRAAGGASAVAARLSQESRSRSRAELEALADSLVTIAVGYRSADPLSDRTAAMRAVVAITVAGSPQHIEERSEQLQAQGALRVPVAYPRAFDRLIEVYERAPTLAIKGSALWMMTQLPDRARALNFLEEVATSSTKFASTAIRYFVSDMGAPGLARLRMLYTTDAVVDPMARQDLIALAAAKGWTR